MPENLAYCPDDIPRCPGHPEGLVRRVVDGDFYILNGERLHTPFNVRSIQYECADCSNVLWSSPPARAALEQSQS